MKLLLILFSTFISIASHQLTFLSELKNGIQQICNESISYSIYVSASSDDVNILNEIIFQALNGTIIRGSELAARNGDPKLPWIVTGPVYVSFNGDGNQTPFLKGLIYVSETADTANLHVYDVKQTININIATNSTIVVLSTFTNAETVVSNWRQKHFQTAALYEGIPNDQIYRIFINPIKNSFTTSQYFINVETFSLKIPVFYGKFVNGINFQLSKETRDLTSLTTFKSNTTGVIAKSDAESNIPRSVSFLKNLSTSGYSGFMSYAKRMGGNVIVSVTYPSEVINTSLSYFNEISKNDLVSKIEINSSGRTAFYVQFYRIETLQNPTIVSTTPTIVSTTPSTPVTKSVSLISLLPSLSLLLVKIL